ncbi:hypothetical protein ACFO3D_14235 [Virgibacillus kekensis]|uniref:Uncharacterized protein n=1 Tax=Virgibacillus kekensis TaxID=202261 RepID=A0ABV9DKH4_9BACI
MGYILPIPHYQYSDYQNRDIQEKRNPFYIEGPYKVMLEYGDWEQEEDTDEEDKYRRTGDTVPAGESEGREADAAQDPAREKIYADLTGKGKNYNFIV